MGAVNLAPGVHPGQGAAPRRLLELDGRQKTDERANARTPHNARRFPPPWSVEEQKACLWCAITTVSSLPMTVPVSGSLPYNDFTSRFPHRVWPNRTSNSS